MQKRLFLLVVTLLTLSLSAVAQVTTSGIDGKVTANNEEVIGATITAKHVPSGTVYRAVTNVNGRYAITGMRSGGPYEVEVSYIGYQTKKFTDLQLVLGQNAVLDVWLDESSEMLQEVQVFSTGGKNNMRTDRAGAVTSVDAKEMSLIPTVSRSMNDILKMTPQGGNTGNGFAVGGGNFRQSYVTVDGAAFNNAFGIGSNLPGNGSPISLDALDQITVSVTPYDVRQSGFTGGAINATTKSGTNEFVGSAYFYNTNVHLRGNKVAGEELSPRQSSHKTTYGATLGGPIIKDKLFFFVNGEYEANVSAGPSRLARPSASDDWGSKSNYNRPTVAKMDEIANYLSTKYGYDPGAYQGYSLKTPAYRILARLDWNINERNKVNIRFSRTHSKDSNSPSTSTTPLYAQTIYPGGIDSEGTSITANSNRGGYTALYFESNRYFQERNFTSFAGEWNSKWGSNLNNTLRMTYSYQDEPRTVVGGTFPTVDILDGGGVYASFGPDPFTPGNLREVKTFVATDEVTTHFGIHNLLAGIQFETNNATNGFMQGGNGYYVFSSWDDFVNGAKPAAYAITTSKALDGSQFKAKMKYNQFSFYVQDQVNLSDRFRLTGGLRFEMPIYPSLKDNFNVPFSQLTFRDGKKFSTDQLPSNSLTVSPRVGFNWDIRGDQSLVLRGGTGYFVGRLPFVWLVSAVGNANCGQVQYVYNTPDNATYGEPNFDPTIAGQLSQLNIKSDQQFAPSQPTIIDKDLKMNATWKTSLAFDAKLPGDIRFSLEGIYGRDFNPAVITDENIIFKENMQISPNDTRRIYEKVNKSNSAYMITNAGNKAYYFSLSASLGKTFGFGLDLNASYTYSIAKSYGDGIGDQVTSAYKTNRYSINGMNELETGYGTYVAPHRVLVSALYRKEYAKNFASSVGLVYEGMNMGYAGTYGYTRYSYIMTSAVGGDGGSNSLIYIPGSREELNDWNFADYVSGETVTYSADQQRTDFWNYIEQDDYLKNHKGEYAERGGVIMPWHHQLDFKFNQDFYIKVGKTRNT
ncbi:MAG: TonB-dependent receptor, partial [Prevotella sp.]|nr:TonB-dependent receptor [Prevotella sp.]